MEEQLANTSRLVGTFDRFLNITECQSSTSQSGQALTNQSVSPDRNAALKRRTLTAKLRLSQINMKSVCLIEQRLHHRDESVKKIQHLWRDYYHRLKTRRDVVMRSEILVHYQVLTHLLSVQHTKKCRAARRLQRWYRRQLSHTRALAKFRFTQQGRWSMSQATKVKALVQGYRIRRVLAEGEARPACIKAALSLLDNANDVLEGICDDINTDQMVQDSVLSLDPGRAMTKALLVYCCLHRRAPSSTSSRPARKVDSALVESFSVYRRLLSQLPVEWAFVENFVREVLNSRAVVANFFTKWHGTGYKAAVVPSICTDRDSFHRPSTLRSPNLKENCKHVHANTLEGPRGTGSRGHKTPTPVNAKAGNLKSNFRTTPEGLSSSRAVRENDDNSAGSTDCHDSAKKALVPKSLLSLMRPFSLEPALPLQHHLENKQLHEHEHEQAWLPMSSIAVSPLQSSPISLFPTPDQAYLSPKRSSRVIPASYCTPPPTRASAGATPSTSTSPGNTSASILSSAGCVSSSHHHTTPMASVAAWKPQYACKPHLQIDIVCAANLGSVSAARRSRNQATRKPGLKVTVSMPAVAQGFDSDGEVAHSSSMKVVQTSSFVCPHDVSPTHPVWNHTLHCPLRVPPSLEDLSFDELISAYWSLGTVKIEVVDAERFNEDIHMGEVTLFLSSFLLAKPCSSSSSSSSSPSTITSRVIAGSFTVTTNPASVSASVSSVGGLRTKTSSGGNGGVGGGGAKLTAAVYLHLPSKKHASSPPTISSSTAESSLTSSQLRRRPTHPVGHSSHHHVSTERDIAANGPTACVPSQIVKSALAHIPAACSGALTASARRQQRLGASTCTLDGSIEITPVSSPSAVAPSRSSQWQQMSLLSAALQATPPDAILSPSTSVRAKTPTPLSRTSTKLSTPGSGHRRRSMENVGTILDFLQDALQEEAEATVESLKQNLITSKRRDDAKAGRQSPPPSPSTSSASTTTTSSLSSPLSSPLSPAHVPTAASSEHLHPHNKCSSSLSAGDVDLESVQHDLDDIMGVLSRRMQAKARLL